ncbi:small nuclear ribonucleoprotein G [Diutina catenulata]
MLSEPELKTYLDKNVSVGLRGNRKVVGVLKGYDVFLNITVVDAISQDPLGDKISIGSTVVRGSSVVSLEALDK